MSLPAGIDDAAAGTLLAALRLLPVTLLSPFLGGPIAPPAVRVGLALAFAWTVHGAAVAAVPLPVDALALTAAAARELTLGAALGMAALLPLEAARAGGRLADTLRGATLTELHVAPLRQRESATGDLLAQWCLVLAAWSGGDRLLLRGLLGTFASVPPGGAYPAHLLGAGGARLATELLACAVSLAAPAAVGILAADLALAVVERVSPGLGIASGAQPTRAALGLAAVALSAAAAGGRLAEAIAFAGRAPGLLVQAGAP